jgi:hypothetical protein
MTHSTAQTHPTQMRLEVLANDVLDWQATENLQSAHGIAMSSLLTLHIVPGSSHLLHHKAKTAPSP